MTRIDACILAQRCVIRHIANLYFPKEALKLKPNVVIDETIMNALAKFSHKFCSSTYSLSNLFEALLYSCDTLESEYLHLQKQPPVLSAELEELYALFLRTVKCLHYDSNKHPRT